jgi:lysine biosynthesis protein LysW
MAKVYCPDCEERIVLNGHTKVGQKLACPHCRAELEVIGIDPLELDWVYDWSYDGDDDEQSGNGDDDW